MTKVIDVVRVGPEHWPLWRQLRRAALAESPGAFGATLDGWSGPGDTEPRWRARLTDVPFNVILSLDGLPVGMVSATAPGPGGAVELISLWVSPAARGRGIGGAAIDQVMSWTALHPGSHVYLSVKADNQWAIRLYRRYGFTDVGPSTEQPDERIMRRRLQVGGSSSG